MSSLCSRIYSSTHASPTLAPRALTPSSEMVFAFEDDALQCSTSLPRESAMPGRHPQDVICDDGPEPAYVGRRSYASWLDGGFYASSPEASPDRSGDRFAAACRRAYSPEKTGLSRASSSASSRSHASSTSDKGAQSSTDSAGQPATVAAVDAAATAEESCTPADVVPARASSDARTPVHAVSSVRAPMLPAPRVTLLPGTGQRKPRGPRNASRPTVPWGSQGAPEANQPSSPVPIPAPRPAPAFFKFDGLQQPAPREASVLQLGSGALAKQVASSEDFVGAFAASNLRRESSSPGTDTFKFRL